MQSTLSTKPRGLLGACSGEDLWPHLLYGGLQGDMQVVHAGQLHGLIYALGRQRVSSEDGVGVPGKQGGIVHLLEAEGAEPTPGHQSSRGQECPWVCCEMTGSPVLAYAALGQLGAGLCPVKCF